MKRRCGTCALCCKLLPVVGLKKPAGERCVHQRGGGCKIYPQRPRECSLWNCLWLIDEGTSDLLRPDFSHYVIDMAPDYITALDNTTGERTVIPVLQIWIDPKFPDAHRDPALRAYLEKLGMAALVRYDSAVAITLLPPSMTREHEWREVTDGEIEPDHNALAAFV